MKNEWQRVGVYLLCQDEAGRVLLTRFEAQESAHSGSWTMPGGGMEWGEQPADTAVREFHEETGLVATLGPLLGVRSASFNAQDAFRGAPGQTLALLFSASAAPGELRTDFSNDDSTVEAGWFTLDEIVALPHVSLVDFALSYLSTQ